jgi:hypothetical protein
VVQFDRIIPPGGEGKIELKVNTKGLSGTIRKQAKVYTNDPKSSTATLTLQANVKIPIRINPKDIYLISSEGNITTQSVIITANEAESLEIVPVQFNVFERVTYEIEEMEKGRVFKVNFKYLPKEGDNVKSALILKTNYPEKPEINIPVYVRFQKKTTNSKDNRSR